MDGPTSLAEVRERLAAPFPEEQISFLPRAANGNRALALAHIDARAVMARLDDACGPDAWSFDWETQFQDGRIARVKGTLTVFGVSKSDAGEANGEDEPLKSAVSDALKRCGVQFGIGRYLYDLPPIWAPYDSQKRRFTETPRLPDWALPNGRSNSNPRSRQEWNERVTAAAEASGPAAAPITGGPPPGADGSPDALLCSEDGCGTLLTPGQAQVSQRSFQRNLCPYHQREAAKARPV